jgi:hypothetical protein
MFAQQIAKSPSPTKPTTAKGKSLFVAGTFAASPSKAKRQREDRSSSVEIIEEKRPKKE